MTQELQTFIQALLEHPRGETIERIEAAEVVDIPFPKEREGPGCEYVMAAGGECGRAVAEPSPKEGEDGAPVYCQVHADWMQLGLGQAGVPFPEDAVSLQQFLAAVADRMLSGKVRMGMEKPLADVCREIARNVRAVEWERRNL